MAAPGDGGIGEAEAASATRNRRTIYDYLGEGEEGEGACSPPSPGTPPRLRLPRFTCARIRFGRKRGGSRAGREEAEESGGASSADSPSGSSKQAAGSTATSSGTSSGAAAQTSMGLSMLLLLARTCVELNRMAEVRAQMEALLKEIRDEAGRVKGAADHATVTPRTCDGNLPSTSMTTASSSCVSDTRTNNRLEIARGEDGRRTPEDEGCAGVVDGALEAELEAVPARRQPPALEWTCSTEQDTAECSMQSSPDEDEFIELEGGRFGGDGGDGGDSDDGSERNEGGVSATELERRLHELRHRRDRERISALESALRRAERRLTEKEMEARLWQETAALALGGQPAPRDAGRGQ
ncbi:protein POLAR LOCALIZATION DURING ASYMMETRIC DIVISION AND REDISTRIBUTION-like isoform X2 [Panicum virgatum]|uniref:protein POLAR LOCALIZATION DURING ASYMMETRIC DIVISION AND REDISTRIBUTION-like isoform X2 n=1 Tax=Panicum virgatum TaxID=38727 RepID=UPI0019D5070E|nr:protein POLAR LOCALIZATION DURING ASYMMETRIC DIVISION AND REDISTRIBUTION-like isoform X2 [Panicum virgatum]